jgi:hypothetical protein
MTDLPLRRMDGRAAESFHHLCGAVLQDRGCQGLA